MSFQRIYLFRDLDAEYVKKMRELLNVEPKHWASKFTNWKHMSLNSSCTNNEDFVLVN